MSERINGELVDNPALLRSTLTIVTTYPTQHDAKLGAFSISHTALLRPIKTEKGRISDNSNLASRGLTDQSRDLDKTTWAVRCSLQRPDLQFKQVQATPL